MSLDYPITPAVRVLRAAGIAFKPHLYDYLDKGGAAHAAQALGLDPHAVIKTLVLEAEPATGRKIGLLMLMHGDREVSTRQLARALGHRGIEPASEAQVQKLTGYLPGGVSPFGTRTPLATCVEASVLDLPVLHINGGKRGFLVSLAPADLQRVLRATPVHATRATDP